MKRETKQIIFVLIMAFLLVIAAGLFAACSNQPKKPDDTTTPVPGTTNAPATTADPVGTTAAPVASTTEPVVTTEPPVVTTEPVVTTAEPPVTTAPEATTEPKPEYINPLTGLGTTASGAALRPVAIVVGNSYNERGYQEGLSFADILYEMPVTPGYTRLMMLTTDYQSLPYICPIRSARDYHIYSAMTHDAIFMSAGGTSADNAAYNIYDIVSENDIDFIDIVNHTKKTTDREIRRYYNQTVDGTYVYWAHQLYSKTASSEYTKTTDGSGIECAIRQLNFSRLVSNAFTNSTTCFNFGEWGKNPAISGSEAQTVEIHFYDSNVNQSHLVTYVYDSKTGTYLRNQYGSAHTDKSSTFSMANGDRSRTDTETVISHSNLLILLTDISEISAGTETTYSINTTTGASVKYGYYFRDGKYQLISWRKNSVSGELKIFDSKGETEIIFNRGKTYIAYYWNTCTPTYTAIDAKLVIKK